MNNSIEIGDKVKIMDDCSAPNAGSEGTVIWISRRLNFTGFKVEIPEIGIIEYARHEIEKLPSTAKPRPVVSVDALLGAHKSSSQLLFTVAETKRR